MKKLDIFRTYVCRVVGIWSGVGRRGRSKTVLTGGGQLCGLVK